MEPRRFYTTYEVSRFLGVSLPTVVNWIKANHLKAHRTPGGHRRIARDELAAFIRRHRMPMPSELAQEGMAARILVVDDDPMQRELMKAFLDGAGYVVELVSTGFAAGLAVGQFKPDVVLLDLMMPGMDGFEVLRTLKAHENTAVLPVVAVTAMKDEETMKRVVEAGFTAFVPKPFAWDQLLSKVESALKRRSHDS